MLLTDTKKWSYEEFEAHIEGMCAALKEIPHERIAFVAHSTPEIIFLFFALWKLKKIACPLSTRLPCAAASVEELGAYLFTPQMPTPRAPTPWVLEGDQHATLLFTSGSTGKPKIACHSLNNHLYSALGSCAIIDLLPEDVWHLSLPLFHVGGIAILFRSYLARSFVSLQSDQQSASYLSLVPTQLIRLQDKKLPHLKGILLGGAPLASSYSSPYKIYPTYGMTEMSSQIATCGHVLPYREVKLAQDREILVRGKTLFQGYFHKTKGLSLPLDSEGWFATKDLGKWDTENQLEITGRKDNLFISGGENIQPEEIEYALKSALPLDEAIVASIPDPLFGARPVAFLKPLYELSLIQEKLKDLLPKYKIPIQVFPIPDTHSLKPPRKLVKEFLEKIALQQEVE